MFEKALGTTFEVVESARDVSRFFWHALGGSTRREHVGDSAPQYFAISFFSCATGMKISMCSLPYLFNTPNDRVRSCPTRPNNLQSLFFTFSY